jgi:hypothetical protein
MAPPADASPSMVDYLLTTIQEDPQFWFSAVTFIMIPLCIIALWASKTLIASIDEEERLTKLRSKRNSTNSKNK